jgi:hypoxanthine phosphoribosyltransferase
MTVKWALLYFYIFYNHKIFFPLSTEHNEVRIGKILYHEETIQAKVREMAEKISEDYDELVLVVVLNGAMFFAVDLMRSLTVPTVVTTLSIGSYGQRGTTSGVVRLNHDIQMDISGKDVLFVEDIIDTGKTLQYLHELFEFRNPKSVKLCSLLSKPSRREVKIDIDYLGFEIEDHFVIGYGLDYKEHFRGLPYVAIAEIVE